MARGTILRSKAQYYEEGEKCTEYFFNLEKDNKLKSTIQKLKDGDVDIIIFRTNHEI